VKAEHSAWPTRGQYLALALLTIGTGLQVHRSGVLLPAAARDVVGDALWAMMIVWWIGVPLPRLDWRLHGASAFTICAVVEVSQLLHWPALDALRRLPLGHLVLGSDFDRRDLAAYAVGVLCAVTVLGIARQFRRQHPRR
jgi:Protein of unknown function (DUF2809)